ncbi:MAG: rhomboid family intramembrane serine protease [Actinobacteria bacterium]|nr:rhomboid family intramembrane serine protease [Actinomycetota bacterium]
MLIPISDANPTRSFPFVTVGLILANVLAFLREPFTGGDIALNLFFYEHAPVPCQLADRCPSAVQFAQDVAVQIPDRPLTSFLVAVLVSTFLHANLLHIAGNMLFLWVFGNNIEDHLGRLKYLLFYLAGGVAAAMAHVLWAARDLPCTNESYGACVPAVGASGAVAAVMGAYMLLFPRARVRVLVPLFIFFIMELPASAVLGLWFVYQFAIGAQELAGPSGIAWMAHVGGFVFGLVAIYLLGGRAQPSLGPWRGS